MKKNKINDLVAEHIESFIPMFKDVRLEREIVDCIYKAIGTTVAVLHGLNALDSIISCENRLPAMWTTVNVRGRKFIIVSYAPIYELESLFDVEVIYWEDDETRVHGGSISEIILHINALSKGEKFDDDLTYTIEPYTKFLSTLECQIGISAYMRLIEDGLMDSIETFVNSLKPSEDERPGLLSFAMFMYQRMYNKMLVFFKRSAFGYIIKFEMFDGCSCELSFNPKNPGKSGVRCSVLEQNGNMQKILIIDDRRELECFINFKTEIATRTAN